MLNRAKGIAGQIIAWRREFHMYPELGFNEIRTSARVADILSGLGFRVRSGVGKTGIIGELGYGLPIIAIRADMDALPIMEANAVDYISQSPGVMHACGHDAHTAIALGVAQLFSNEKFEGTLRLIFQPAEEVADAEGVSGAPRMIADGALDNVDKILALHVDPSTISGKIGISPGIASAGVDTFYAWIIGKGGHGAMPHQTVDPIFISGNVILAIHGIVSRRLYPLDAAVISIGSIHGGQADNVIPEEVEIKGTIRYLDTRVQQTLHKEIENALSISRSLGGEYKLVLEIGYPPMINDPEVIESIRKVATDLLGSSNVLDRKIEMGAEDFGFMSAKAPGAMFSLGSAWSGAKRKLHSSDFNIDEDCLPIGAAILAETALRDLGSGI